MMYYLKTILSIFCVLWINSVNAQIDLGDEYAELNKRMHSFKVQNNYDSTMFYWAKTNVLLVEKNKKEYNRLTKWDLFWISSHFKKDLKTLEAALDLYNDFSDGIYDSNSSGFWEVSEFLSKYMLRFDNYNKAQIFLSTYKNSKYYTIGSHNKVDYLIADILIKKGEVDSA